MNMIYKYKKNWDYLAKKNPLWAILTEKKIWEKKAFFNTGKKEINEVFNHLKQCKQKINYEKALDFGCGIGRLTQALCPMFDKVVGVDISSQMISLANKSNQFKSKCQYRLNNSIKLKQFHDGSISFIYSSITLQHNNPKFIFNYLKEFIRILKKGGVCVFQLPSHPANTIKGMVIRIIPSFILDHIRKMEMHGIGKDNIVAFLLKNKLKIILVKEELKKKNNFIGEGWVSYKYFFEK